MGVFARRFEELEVWRKSRTVMREVYRMTASEAFGRDWSLRDQMRRSSVSIMSNIAEGFERQSRKEFARFIEIAKGSCGELRAQFYVAEDAGFLSEGEAGFMRKDARFPGCWKAFGAHC